MLFTFAEIKNNKIHKNNKQTKKFKKLKKNLQSLNLKIEANNIEERNYSLTFFFTVQSMKNRTTKFT